jgi:hypothetical protein
MGLADSFRSAMTVTEGDQTVRNRAMVAFCLIVVGCFSSRAALAQSTVATRVEIENKTGERVSFQWSHLENPGKEWRGGGAASAGRNTNTITSVPKGQKWIWVRAFYKDDTPSKPFKVEVRSRTDYDGLIFPCSWNGDEIKQK